MPVVVIPHVLSIISPKGKHLCALVFLLIIAPQFSIRPICNHITVRAVLYPYPVIVGDSQKNPLTCIILLLPGKDLIHCPFIIHQISTELIPFHGEAFLYLVNLLAVCPLPGRHIGKSHAPHHPIHFLQPYLNLPVLHHLQSPPCQMRKAGVNTGMAKRAVILAAGRLHIGHQLLCLIIIKGFGGKINSQINHGLSL